MSLATVLGLVSGIGLFLWSIALSTDNFMVFIDVPSVIMVLGGTFASTFISYEARYVILAFKRMGSIVFAQKMGRGVLTNEVGRVIRWGYIVQKNGLPGLEADAGKVRKQDRFLGFGIDLVISGYTGEEIRQIMSNTVETTYQRGLVQPAILKTMGAICPAFGMIGTLVGLIVMLDNMSDPSMLGKGLAVALLTTLYAVLAARIVFIPAATKLQQREDIVMFRNYLVAEGLALLAERKSPRYIQDKMNS
ncbi:MAG: flagellar motor protein MotA, partial [Alphaproteobacteria bacterium RIFOXYD12_FULL_60_8]